MLKIMDFTVNAKLYSYERELWSKQLLLSGVDEVGRGCLAGPVVACCLVLHPHATHPFLRDSKLLSENKRGEVAVWLQDNSWYGIGAASASYIDAHNIYQATLYAMERAYYHLLNHPQLAQQPSLMIVDAMPLQLPEIEIRSFTKGESKSASVAGASIIAKVMRDKLMQEQAYTFPCYHFEQNKGYGSVAHMQALQEYGPSTFHRATFIKKCIKEPEHDRRKQRSLFR